MNITLKRIGLDGLYVTAEGRLDLDNAVEYGSKIKDFFMSVEFDTTPSTENMSP